MQAFHRMLQFYGFTIALDSEKHPIVIRADNFNERKSDWLTPKNHNYRRISRILESLCLLGVSDAARIFYNALNEVYEEYSSLIGWTTLNYWKEAVES